MLALLNSPFCVRPVGVDARSTLPSTLQPSALIGALATPSAEPFLKCPAGSFLSGENRTAAEAALLALHRQRTARGWAPLPSTAGGSYAARGFVDWSSSPSLHPPLCALRKVRKGASRQMPDTWATPALMRYVLSSPPPAARIEAVSNFKAASESMIEYWSCEAGASGGVLTYPSATPCAGDGAPCVSTMPVRDPVSRFVSAMLEIVQRIANNYCPVIACVGCPAEAQPCFASEAERLAAAAEADSWYRYVAGGSEAGNASIAAGDMPTMLAEFLADLSCSKHVYAYEHLLTQSAFAADASGGLDVVVGVDELTKGLDAVAARANFTRRCAVKPENVGSGKPGTLPTKGDFMDVLVGNASLLQTVCDVYAQDFICFGLPMPVGCEVLKR